MSSTELTGIFNAIDGQRMVYPMAGGIEQPKTQYYKAPEATAENTVAEPGTAFDPLAAKP